MQDPSVSFIESQPLSETRLSESDIQSWSEKGFALVHDLLPRPLLVELKQDAQNHYPVPGNKASKRFTDFSSGQSFVFPSRSTAFNAVTLHPALLQAAADLLAVPVMGLRLSQSDLWPKYGSPNPKNGPRDRCAKRGRQPRSAHALRLSQPLACASTGVEQP